MTKQELRLLYKQKRAAIPSDRKSKMDASIIEQLIAIILDQSNIGIFLPIQKFNEIDLTPLLKFEKCNWYVPKTNFKETSMCFVKIDKNSVIEENEFGIPEPISNDIIDPSVLDVIIVPMLLADKKGYRVGYGKGFYDRFLPLCRPDCLRIGVSYFASIDTISDVQEHDETIQICVNPKLDSF